MYTQMQSDEKSQQGEDHNHYSKFLDSPLPTENKSDLNERELTRLQLDAKANANTAAKSKSPFELPSSYSKNQLKEKFEIEVSKRKKEFK
mmetsp:Transcript_5107/g.6030  ORF Transcript_5107/g.6030 Transcript_5107/m.6030 type:complete len:90 (-) Transcript_5107:869-1138(-)